MGNLIDFDDFYKRFLSFPLTPEEQETTNYYDFFFDKASVRLMIL